MPVYHVVLFKLKPNTSAESLAPLHTMSQAMVGQVPGLTKISVGAPLAATAHRAQGFDCGLVAILDSPGDLPGYAQHPAHLRVLDVINPLKTDLLAYDLEF